MFQNCSCTALVHMRAPMTHDAMSRSEAILESLNEEPTHFPGCCPAISRLLICLLIDWLPRDPALTLSIGCGSGLLEAVLLDASIEHHGELINLHGVEVESCVNSYLPAGRFMKVPDTGSLCDEAMLASALLFVYPRSPKLIKAYLSTFSTGTLETVFWLGHRNDWAVFAESLCNAFPCVQILDGPGIAEYELLVIASVSDYTVHD